MPKQNYTRMKGKFVIWSQDGILWQYSRTFGRRGLDILVDGGVKVDARRTHIVGELKGWPTGDDGLPAVLDRDGMAKVIDANSKGEEYARPD